MNAPSPPLDDEQDPTGFLQIERATRALEYTIVQTRQIWLSENSRQDSEAIAWLSDR